MKDKIIITHAHPDDIPEWGKKEYEDRQKQAKMPEDITGDPYILKSTVDAQRAADSKTIKELAGALGQTLEIVNDSRNESWIGDCYDIEVTIKKALSDHAKQIEKAGK